MPKTNTELKVIMKTYVYIIKADTFIKIGFSGNPDRRLKEMQTGSPHELEILAKLPYETREEAAAKEKEFHLLFATWHHRGEWFYADGMKRALNIPTEILRDQRAAEKESKRLRRKKIKNPNKGRKRYSKEMLAEANAAGVALRSK